MTTIGMYTRFVKGDEERIFYVFDDGSAREMTNGFGRLYDNHLSLFRQLKAQGYTECYKMA